MDLQINSPTMSYGTTGLWGLNNPPIAGQVYTINFSQFTSATSNFMSDRVLGNTYNILPIALGGGSANAIPFTIPSSVERFTSPNVEVQTMYSMKLAHMIATILLIVGGLNWGSKAILGKDLLSNVLGDFPLVTRVIFGLVGLAALAVMFHRDTYLPFLGETVMPCSVLAEKTPDGANTTVSVKVEPGAKVLFWAAEPGSDVLKTMHTWQEAYLKFANAGVTTADSSGRATLRVRQPQPYTVPLKGTLQPHVHFRVCRGGGMMDRVETKYLTEEGFTNRTTTLLVEELSAGHPKKKPSDYDPDVVDDGSNGQYGASGDGWSGAGVEDFNQHGVSGNNSMSGATLEDGIQRNKDWTVGSDGGNMSGTSSGFAKAETDHPLLNSLQKEGFLGSDLNNAFTLPFQGQK